MCNEKPELKREGATLLSGKDAYEEAGRNSRYFLSWRERLLAGYFALLSGLAVAYWKLDQTDSQIRWMPFAAGLFLTLVMWALEDRNRDLYRACNDSAKACESGLPEGTGMFTRMLTNKKALFYHSTTFNILFIVVATVLLVWGILVYCEVKC